jgi:hypothetical protein
VVDSFFEGLRRLSGLEDFFSMRDLKRWDFITRLSFFVLAEREEGNDGSPDDEGREMRPEPDCVVVGVGVDFEEAFERIEVRFLGAVGAWAY